MFTRTHTSFPYTTLVRSIAVVLVRGAQVLVESAALQKAGVQLEAGVATQRIGGRDFVGADAIGHGIRVAIDRALLRLQIRRPPTALPLQRDRKSTRLNSSHSCASRMPSSA